MMIVNHLMILEACLYPGHVYVNQVSISEIFCIYFCKYVYYGKHVFNIEQQYLLINQLIIKLHTFFSHTDHLEGQLHQTAKKGIRPTTSFS